jgi:hypothetical protein
LKTQHHPWRSWNRWKIKPSKFQNVAYVKQEEAEKIATTALAALKNILYIPLIVLSFLSGFLIISYTIIVCYFKNERKKKRKLQKIK